MSELSRFSKDLLTVPNILSLFRVFATPVFVWLWMGLDWKVAALVLGVVCGLTDLFDGVLARKLNQVTEIGGLIDQLGDLFFESVVLVLAVLFGRLWIGWLLIYLFRELTVTVVRSWVHSQGAKLPSSMLGKAKSNFLQWSFLLFFLGVILEQPGVLPAAWTLVGVAPGTLLVWLATASILVGLAAGLVSGWRYFRAFVGFYVAKMG